MDAQTFQKQHHQRKKQTEPEPTKTMPPKEQTQPKRTTIKNIDPNVPKRTNVDTDKHKPNKLLKPSEPAKNNRTKTNQPKSQSQRINSGRLHENPFQSKSNNSIHTQPTLHQNRTKQTETNPNRARNKRGPTPTKTNPSTKPNQTATKLNKKKSKHTKPKQLQSTSIKTN